jgi:integrase
VLDRKGRQVVTPTLIFHDLRRSAVRNLVTAGVDQSVAMRVTGHQTISVFQRYRIVSDDDVRAALVRTQAVLGRVSGTEPGHNSGHNGSTEAAQSSGGAA